MDAYVNIRGRKSAGWKDPKGVAIVRSTGIL